MGYGGFEPPTLCVSLVVLAPSMHWTGNQYKWEDADIPPAPAPQWLLELIKKPERPAERPAFTGKPLDLEKFIAKHPPDDVGG